MNAECDCKELSNARGAEDRWYRRLFRYLSKRTLVSDEHRLPGAHRMSFLDELAVYSPGGLDLRGPFWRPGNTSIEDDVHD